MEVREGNLALWVAFVLKVLDPLLGCRYKENPHSLSVHFVLGSCIQVAVAQAEFSRETRTAVKT